MIWDKFPRIIIPQGRLQWRLCGCGVVGGVLEPGCHLSPPQIPRSHRQGILGFLHHEMASFTGAPITTREEAGSMSRD